MAVHLSTISLFAGLATAQNSISIHGERTHCDTSPCQNGGICRMVEGSEAARAFVCECTKDWTGVYCDVPYPAVTCGESEISVLVDKRLVTDHGLEENQSLVSFMDTSDPNCHAVADGDNYRLTIKSPFSSCGTDTTRKEDDDYTFKNKVMWKKVYKGQEGEADISREIVLVDFRCEYEDEYLLHLVPIKPAEKTIDQETSKGNFRIKMGLYKDRTFVDDRQLAENPIVAIDEEVCVQMNLVNTLGIKNLVLSVKDCWTSSQLDGGERHSLIEKKCEAENEYSVDVIYNGISDVTQFCFHMFKWSESMDQVYLQCEVNVCDDTVHHKGISQCQCPPEGFDLNDWIYPNYYNSMYYDYVSNNQPGDGLYADYVNNYGRNDYNGAAEPGNAYYYDYIPTDQEAREPEEAEGNSRRRKRAVKQKPVTIEISKDKDGNIVVPDKVKIAPPGDLIKMDFGPIKIITERSNRRDAIISVQNVTDEGPWFEEPQGSELNVVVVAVGIALLLAMIILGIVIGAYVQCKKKWDRRSQKIRELSKVREFYQGVLRPGSEGPASETGSQKANIPAFVKE